MRGRRRRRKPRKTGRDTRTGKVTEVKIVRRRKGAGKPTRVRIVRSRNGNVTVEEFEL